MRATKGMTADYSAHDAFQRATAGAANDLVRDAAVRVASSVGGTFVLVDYGCATNPHVALIRETIGAIRNAQPGREIEVVHADLPTNDWNTLIAAAVDTQAGYVTGFEPQPITAIAPRSFFEPVVSPASVHLGISFSAAHWLREQPRMDAGSWCFCDAREPARTQLSQLAARDWESFWSARAREVVAGGVVIVQTIGQTTENGVMCVTAHDLLTFMRDIAMTFLDDSRLHRARFDKFVFPTYARSVEEARAPFEKGGALEGDFAIERLTVFPVANPYLPMLQSGDVRGYATSYIGFVRAFTATTLREGLFAGDGALLDAFYARAIDAIEEDPKRGMFRDWTLQVVVRKR